MFLAGFGAFLPLDHHFRVSGCRGDALIDNFFDHMDRHLLKQE
jgi:hypothetical protein